MAAPDPRALSQSCPKGAAKSETEEPLERKAAQNREQGEYREFDDLADKAQIAAIALEDVQKQCDDDHGKRREQQDPDDRHA